MELEKQQKYQMKSRIPPLRNRSPQGFLKRIKTTHHQSHRNVRSFVGSLYSEPAEIPIHERLHRDGYKKSQKKVVNDCLKQNQELKDCTFKPNSTIKSGTPSQSVTRREDPFLFERLSKSTKKFNPELIQMQKDAEEMRECTFKPTTN